MKIIIEGTVEEISALLKPEAKEPRYIDITGDFNAEEWNAKMKAFDKALLKAMRGKHEES